MGFDLHGINPVIREGKEPKRPDNLWSKDISEKERNKYFDKKDAFEDNNPGIYFRNNCWWWRSLWDYVYNECDDILTEKDWESGHYNDGHQISEEKAVAIGKRLNEQIESGRAEAYVKSHEQERNEAKEGNKGLKVGDEGYNWSESYPLDLENIQRFAVFCSESGGFTIC
tara:strand:+ start:765 stop:1274 length:510 start_codon:yes stop_codon:yes gene_type:complete